MYVQIQELSPRVQHGDEARVHLQQRPGACHAEQRLRGGREEQVVDQRPVVLGQLGERLGQRKDQVCVIGREHLGQTVLIPRVPPVAAALRAMPIATRVDVVLGVPTGVALPHVSAQDGRATDFHLPQRAVLLRRQTPRALPPIRPRVTPEDIRQLQARRTERWWSAWWARPAVRHRVWSWQQFLTGVTSPARGEAAHGESARCTARRTALKNFFRGAS